MRTQFTRILRKAGLEPWPRPFHNLRASFATDLTADFPSHVVASWLGHTEEIAEAHYWQTTEAHCDQARQWSPSIAATFVAEGAGIVKNKAEGGFGDLFSNPNPINYLRRKSLWRKDLKAEGMGLEPNDETPYPESTYVTGKEGDAAYFAALEMFKRLADLWPHLPTEAQENILALAERYANLSGKSDLD